MNKVLKRYHLSKAKDCCASIIISLLFGMMMYMILRLQKYSTSVSLSASLAFMFCVYCISYLCLSASGLYINGEKLYYKNPIPIKTSIDLRRIFAIKVCHSVTSIRGAEDKNIVDETGNQLYTMFFLKESDLWSRIKKDLSDCTFRVCYGEYIVCSCIYDQSVIDYLLTLNPNIIVF